MRTLTKPFYTLLCILALLILWDGRSALALAPAEKITTQQFWQRIDKTITTLQELKNNPKESIPDALDKLANEWERVDTLVYPDNTTVPLNTSYIISQLHKRPYNLNTLIERFTDLKDARNIHNTRSFENADLQALQTILQRPEFQWNRPPSPLEELWNQFWDRVNKWLNNLFGGNGVEVPIPSEVFTIGAGLVLALILLYVFRNLFSDFFMEASAKDEQMAGDELLTAESALQKAKDISRGGDYRTAVRYLYISSLLTLDERGLMRFDRSKTNREYLRSVASFPQLSAPLREVIDVFDRVWYGFQPLDEDDFEHYAEKVDQLREQKK